MVHFPTIRSQYFNRSRIIRMFFSAVCLFAIIILLTFSHGSKRWLDTSLIAPLFSNTTIFLYKKCCTLVDNKSEQGSHSSVQQAITEVKDFVEKYQVERLARKLSSVQHVFLLTTWRSGSSFFGEALSSHPAIFYHYEPLMYFSYREIHGAGQDLEDALRTLGNLSQCEYSRVPKYMSMVQSYFINFLLRNFKIRSQCMKLKHQCFDNHFLKETCKLFPVQVFKINRLRGKAVEELLHRYTNSKIVYLTRDPRAIYSSRIQTGWCRKLPSFCNAHQMCDTLEEDLVESNMLLSNHAENVFRVRYEDIALNPEKTLMQVYKFLDLDWHENTQKYLDEHTNSNVEGILSTFRNSAKQIDRWRHDLSNEAVQNIQEECRSFMIDLQYGFVN